MAGNVIELAEHNFEEVVLKSDKPVIVDFWATWCMPCKMLAPTVEEIAGEHKGKYKVAKLNIDDAMDIATNFSVMNIPTLIFFKDGKEVNRFVGINPKEKINKVLEKLI